MWRGAISFGMVAIPVRMYLATEAHSAVSFRQLCPHCQLPIKQQRHCPTDDHVVAFNDVLKGYEVSKNQFVLIDEEDLDKLPLKTTRTIDIVEFVERNEVPLGLYVKSAYYLEPEEVGVKPFYLLKRALEDTNKVAVFKDAKKAFDDYTAQAAKEPLAVKLADAVGHNRVAINFTASGSLAAWAV